MKTLLILLTVTVVLLACNAVTEPAPEDPLVPTGVMQFVENTYKDPHHMVFTEILSSKIWNLELKSQAKKYSLIMGPKNIKVAYRRMATEVPDSLRHLLDTSVIAGGTFSDFKEQEFISFSELSYEKTGIATFCWRNLLGNIFFHRPGESSIPQTPWNLYLIDVLEAPQVNIGLDLLLRFSPSGSFFLV